MGGDSFTLQWSTCPVTQAKRGGTSKALDVDELKKLMCHEMLDAPSGLYTLDAYTDKDQQCVKKNADITASPAPICYNVTSNDFQNPIGLDGAIRKNASIEIVDCPTSTQLPVFMEDPEPSKSSCFNTSVDTLTESLDGLDVAECSKIDGLKKCKPKKYWDAYKCIMEYGTWNAPGECGFIDAESRHPVKIGSIYKIQNTVNVNGYRSYYDGKCMEVIGECDGPYGTSCMNNFMFSHEWLSADQLAYMKTFAKETACPTEEQTQ